MRLTYVIPDLHGRDDLLARALQEINAHARGDAGAIVILGDYVNKGPATRQVIERLLPGIAGARRFIALKGNHDAMMVDGLRNPGRRAFWLERGGEATLASYGGDPACVPPAHIAWLDRLPLIHVDAQRIYVHAGIDPALPLDRQSEETLLWKRYPADDPGGHGGRHVVHGHDNDPNGPLLFAGRTNLDTAAWKTGRLTVGIFDDDRPGGPQDLLVIQGAPGV